MNRVVLSVGCGALGWVEPFKGAAVYQVLAQAGVFFIGAITPVDAGRLGEGGHVSHPSDQFGIFDVAGNNKSLVWHSANPLSK